jgi:asparagine synthase (glutamine-hydrolysing)
MSYNELVDEIGNVIVAFDQPFSGTISTYFLTKLIRKHVKVAISGDAADELFGSYLSHRVAQPIYHFTRLYDKVRSNKLTETDKRLFAPCDFRFLEELFDKSGGDEVKWRYHLCLFLDEEKERLLTDHFKSQLNGANSFLHLKKHFNTLTAKEPLNRILEMEWNTQLPDQVLAFVDFLSMAHSVEIRSPFLDYRFVEFVATIPGNMKIRDGNVKDLLKKTVEPLIPEGITKRPKEGFVLPIFDWMVEKLRDYSLDVLSEKRLKRHNLLNTEVVKNILEDYYSGNKSVAGKVWNLMMFQVWWEKYFE